MDFFGVPSYATKMLPKIFPDKTMFVKFKISNNFEQKNIDEADLKQSKIHTSLWILKSQEKNPRTKSLETFAKSLLFSHKNPYPRVWI